MALSVVPSPRRLVFKQLKGRETGRRERDEGEHQRGMESFVSFDFFFSLFPLSLCLVPSFPSRSREVDPPRGSPACRARDSNEAGRKGARRTFFFSSSLIDSLTFDLLFLNLVLLLFTPKQPRPSCLPTSRTRPGCA